MSGQWWESDLLVGPFTDIAAANAWAAANPSSLFNGLLATAGGVQIQWNGSAWVGPRANVADPYLVVDHSETAPYTMVYKHSNGLLGTRVLSTTVVPTLSQVTGTYTRSVRDPFIIRFNGIYVCVYTDSALQTIPANGAGFGLAVSKDLLTWTDHQILPGSFYGGNVIGYIWAPKLFVFAGQLYVTFAANINTSGLQIFIAPINTSQSTSSPYAITFAMGTAVPLAIDTTSQPEDVIQIRMYDPMVAIRPDGSAVIAMSDSRNTSGHYSYVSNLIKNGSAWYTSPIKVLFAVKTENTKILLSDDGVTYCAITNNLADPGKNIYTQIDIYSLSAIGSTSPILKIPATATATGESYLPVTFDFFAALHAIE